MRKLFLLLFTLNCHFVFGQNQEIIPITYKILPDTNSNCTINCDSVIVEFTIPYGNNHFVPNEATGQKKTRLEVFMDFGDGTFNETVIINDENEISISNPASSSLGDPIGTTGSSRFARSRASTRTYREQHTYFPNALPNSSLPVQAYATSIYTSGDDPFGRVSNLEMDSLVREVRSILKNDVEQKRLLNISTDSLVHLYYNRQPYPDENMLSVLHYRNPTTEPIVDGRLLLFYNLGQFIGSDFRIDTDNIRTYKGESVRDTTYEGFLNGFRNEDYNVQLEEDQFDDVLEIRFDILHPNEKRSVFIPIQCPDDVYVNPDKDVTFLSVFLDETTIRGFLGLNSLIFTREYVKDKGQIGSTQSGGTVQSQSTTYSTTQLPPNFPKNGREETVYFTHTTSGLDNDLSLLSKQENNLSEELINMQLQVAIDPNNMAFKEKCFREKSMFLTCTINFENEVANTYAKEVNIDVLLNEKVKRIIQNERSSVGTLSKRFSGDTLKFTITNVCLGGPSSDDCISTGFVQFQIPTQAIRTEGDSVILNARIRFGEAKEEDSEDYFWTVVDTPATSVYMPNGKDCWPLRQYSGFPFGIRIGAQYPLAFQDLSFSNFKDNYFLGAFWNSRTLKDKFYFRAETGIANLGMQDEANNTFRALTSASSLQLRYRFGNRWTIGAGFGYDKLISSFENGVKRDRNAPRLAFEEDRKSAFLDLSFYLGRTVHLDFRLNAYLNTTYMNREVDRLWAPSLAIDFDF